MTDLELLLDWLNDLSQDLRGEIEPLTPEALYWQSHPEASSIGVTVWHVARWMDVLKVRAFQDGPAEEEVWHTRGWRERTGYGQRGFGAVTGYSATDVAAIPQLSANDLLAYLDQTHKALRDYLAALPPDALGQTTPGLGGKHTVYKLIKIEWQHFFGHLGEIQALKAMWERERR